MAQRQDAVQGRLAIHVGYEPGLIGRVGELHGRYYATAWGIGARLMTREFCDFIERYDPERIMIDLTDPPSDRPDAGEFYNKAPRMGVFQGGARCVRAK